MNYSDIFVNFGKMPPESGFVSRKLRLIGQPHSFHQHYAYIQTSVGNKMWPIPFPDSHTSRRFERTCTGNDNCPWCDMGYMSVAKYAVRCLEIDNAEYHPRVFIFGSSVMNQLLDIQKAEPILGQSAYPVIVAAFMKSMSMRAYGVLRVQNLFNIEDNHISAMREAFIGIHNVSPEFEHLVPNDWAELIADLEDMFRPDSKVGERTPSRWNKERLALNQHHHIGGTNNSKPIILQLTDQVLESETCAQCYQTFPKTQGTLGYGNRYYCSKCV